MSKFKEILLIVFVIITCVPIYICVKLRARIHAAYWWITYGRHIYGRRS
jgi:hypothetical protein